MEAKVPPFEKFLLYGVTGKEQQKWPQAFENSIRLGCLESTGISDLLSLSNHQNFPETL